MAKKQFALIFLVFAVVMSLILANLAWGAEVGMVKADTTCLRSEIDLKTTEIRLKQLVHMIDRTKDESVILVLKTEAQSVFRLNRVIKMWLVENCRVS